VVERTCSIEGCPKPVRARGWCTRHYYRWHRNGNPLLTVRRVKGQFPCSVVGCPNPADTRGWCHTHYARWKRHGTTADPVSFPTICSIEGCPKLHATRGWCGMHAERWRRYGDPLLLVGKGRPTAPLADRFWSKVAVGAPDECWPWTEPVDANGYPDGFYTKERTYRSHRLAYELEHGPIPVGLTIDHACHNRDLTCPGGITCLHRRCCNPWHLEAVTAGDNVRRAVAHKMARKALYPLLAHNPNTRKLSRK